MATASRSLRRGERAPDFVLPTAAGTLTRFYGVAGGQPTALVFSETLAKVPSFGPAVAVVVILRTPPDTAPEGLRLFVDPADAVRDRYGVTEDAVLALDANLRILEVLGLGAPQEWAQTAGFAGPALEVDVQAPVLLIPNALPPELVEELLQVFVSQGSRETGVERSEDGTRQERLAPSDKRRRDHVVEDPELLRRLSESIGRRVLPEVQQAFSFRASRFEGFKIARYEPGGHFRAHRDNLSPSTAHRRFALTLNLNDGYQGGQLRFPEHAPHLYRPPPGGALVFSCSLLHEVLPVLEGERFVLLSFLFGAEDQRARDR